VPYFRVLCHVPQQLHFYKWGNITFDNQVWRLGQGRLCVQKSMARKLHKGNRGHLAHLKIVTECCDHTMD
jgi:hypothetical protein